MHAIPIRDSARIFAFGDQKKLDEYWAAVPGANIASDLQKKAGRLGDDSLLGRPFVSRELSFVISESAAPLDHGATEIDNFMLQLPIDTPGDDDDEELEEPYDGRVPWYVERLGGWPSGRAKDIPVAVFDGGFEHTHPQLAGLVAPNDFLCFYPEPQDCIQKGHGIESCGVIVGRKINNWRIGIAPDCRLIVGQSAARPDRRATLIELLIFLAWCVERKVRIVSIAFGAERQTVSKGATAFLEGMFRILRHQFNIVCFCAAGEAAKETVIPACLKAAQPVSGYVQKSGTTDIVVDPLQLGLAGPAPASEMFVGPSEKVLTTGCGGIVKVDFGESSAACSFVAGIAALFLEKAPHASAGKLIAAMKAHAEVVSGSNSNCKYLSPPFPL